MTDNEIIKALECCGKNILCIHCPLCEMQQKEGLVCEDRLKMYALDLINRQKVEIEKLKTEIALLKGAKKICVPKMKLDEFNITLEHEEYVSLWQAAKIEAYKEFAEEVNKELFGEEYPLDRVHRRAVERILNRLISRR